MGLVDTTTGAEVWSERYQRPLNDLFAVQEELTARIADSLGRPAGRDSRCADEGGERQAGG